MERNWLIGAAGILAVLIVGSAAIALSRGASDFDRNSAEFAVQQYLNALVAEDFAAAEEMWTPQLRDVCSFDAFRLDTHSSLDRLAKSRITLKDVLTIGESTVVSVRGTRTASAGLLGPDERRFSSRIKLTQLDGQWLIQGQTWPSNECLRTQFDLESKSLAAPTRSLD